MTRTYKSIQQLKQYVTDILKYYQHVIVTGIHRDKTLLDHLVVESQDFCRALMNNHLEIGNTIGTGGINFVAPLISDGKQVWAQFNSFRHDKKGWRIGYSNVISRSSNADNADIITGVDFDKNGYLGLPDPLYDSLIQGLVTTLYNTSISPHVTNSFANYVCQDQRGRYSSYNIVERASFSLGTHFEKVKQSYNTGKGFKEMTDNTIELYTLNNLVSWTLATAWTTYVWKKYYNITNFDLHPGNMLLCDLEEGEYNTSFDGKNMRAIDWILYPIPGENTGIAVQRSRYLFKLSDYGFAMATLKGNKGFPTLKITNNNPARFYDQDYALSREDLFSTLEVAYVMRVLALSLDVFINVMGITKLQNTLDKYEQFCLSIDPTFDYKAIRWFNYPVNRILEGQIKRPGEKKRTMKAKGINAFGLIQQRVWGVPNQPIDQPLVDIYRFLKANKKTFNVNESRYQDNKILILHDGEIMTPSQLTEDEVAVCFAPNDISTYIQSFQETMGMKDIVCNPSKHKDMIKKYLQGQDLHTLCSKYTIDAINIDPSSYQHDPIISTTLDPSKDKSLVTKGILRSDIDVWSLDDKYSLVDRDVFQLIIEPNNANWGEEMKRALSYQEYQRDINYKVPKDVGKPIESVSIEFVTIYPDAAIEPVVASKNTVLYNYINKKAFMAISGGYFIVQGNLNNKLTAYLSEDDIGKPIGPFFDRIKMTEANTIVPIPLPYIDYFQVVVQNIDNTISVLKYKQLINDWIDTIIQLENGSYLAIKIPTIKHVDKQYIKLFCIGPTLIHNGKNVFDMSVFHKEMILDSSVSKYMKKSTLSASEIISKFELPNNSKITTEPILNAKYKLKNDQKGYKLFYSEEGERNFIYGMRSGNNLHVNAALCITKDEKLLFAFSQGRGYNTPGLDRVQFTWLLSHFNIKQAIAIDGGFTATAIYPDDNNKPTFLLNKPETDSERSMASGFLIV